MVSRQDTRAGTPRGGTDDNIGRSELIEQAIA
jgi:hypothetical protein